MQTFLVVTDLLLQLPVWEIRAAGRKPDHLPCPSWDLER